MTIQKCGFVAILGEPNAGKSTLVNQIVGSKVSIVSPKVQTTRRRILGIAIRDEAQLILIDTPGIFMPRRSLEKAMVKTAYESIQGADCTVLLVDASQRNFEGTHQILEHLGQYRPVILALNKIDLIEPSRLLQIVADLSKYTQITDTFMISALRNDGVEDLVKLLANKMKEGPWHYPEDQLTDLPMRLWAAEITREQLILQLRQELPYETYVETEKWEQFENGSVKINQAVVVAREAQKPIILGKKGQQIKKISMEARLQMEELLGYPVHLILFVKVKDNWMEKPALLQEAGITGEV
ncbi:MAG: GTPase Era [Alphaproteobacteria bacterium]|nr:GTPase Era [Alphaproteobacteria bacterium]